jgi:hypothetical protein
MDDPSTISATNRTEARSQAMGRACFEGCFSLQTASFGGRITQISVRAFVNCSALQRFCLPAGVGTIRVCAFSGCCALSLVECAPGAKLTRRRLITHAVVYEGMRARVCVYMCVCECVCGGGCRYVPGAKCTRSKPNSCLITRWPAAGWKYAKITSSPVTDPVLVTVTE